MNKSETLRQARLSAPLRLAPEVKRLVSFLQDSDLKEHSYQELSELIGVDVSYRGPGKRFLWKAREILWREHSLFFGCIDGEGIRLLTNEEIVRYGERITRSTGRRAGRESQKLSCADYSALTQEQKVSFNAHKMMLELIAAVPRKVLRKKIEQAAASNNQQLAIERTLEALTK